MATIAAASAPISRAEEPGAEIDRRVYGMLVGSAIGDAAGGPVEFQDGEKLAAVLPRYRQRPDVRLDPAGLRGLAETFPLLAYRGLRPGVEPYGQWTPNAPAGTVTDDTRHKMVVVGALRRGLAEGELPIDRRALAAEILRFDQRPAVKKSKEWQALSAEGWGEFCLASRWVLGERDPALALPPERLWCGAGTCCGQMAFPPLAGVYPGDPDRAYLAAYELGFIDNGYAKDINAAIVAGLAFALAEPAPGDDPAERRKAWRAVLDAMRRTDPLRLGEIDFMRRPVDRWIDRGLEAAKRADRSPKRLYAEIERLCPHENAWDAHFLLCQAVAMVEFSEGEPLAAMHLALDYGQDTDSVAQLMGAFFGAVHGPGVFPQAMRRAVAEQLEADYQESLDEWVEVLAAARRQQRRRPVVRPLFGAE